MEFFNDILLEYVVSVLAVMFNLYSRWMLMVVAFYCYLVAWSPVFSAFQNLRLFKKAKKKPRLMWPLFFTFIGKLLTIIVFINKFKLLWKFIKKLQYVKSTQPRKLNYSFPVIIHKVTKSPDSQKTLNSC